MDYKRILAIKYPGDLFKSDNEKDIKEEFIELCKHYHPDNLADADNKEEMSMVMSKINEMYSLALKMIELGTWEREGCIKIRSKHGKGYEVKYRYDYSFELGHAYLTKGKMIFVISGDKEKFCNNLIKNIKKISYKNNVMKEKFSASIPSIYDYFEDVYGNHVVIMDKDKDYVPLREVFHYFGDKLDARHVAWIVSRLSNIACLLEMNNLSSNGLTIDNILVSPVDHGIAVHGALFYSGCIGAKMIGTVNNVYEVMPDKIKAAKEASIETDLEAIKMIGRELCGEKNVVKFKDLKDVPQAMKDFLTKGSGKSSFEEFEAWDNSLTQAFGRRRFVKMEYKNFF